MIRLYHYLDRNDNGILTSIEITRAPWTSLLFPPFTAIRASQRPQVFEVDSKGNLTFDKFLSYLSKAWDIEPVTLQVSPVAVPVPATRTDLVFQLLDHDSDRKVSLAELKMTDDRLVNLDRDEDELLDQTEIAPEGERMPAQVVRRRVTQPGVPNYEIIPAVALTSVEVRTAVATRLLSSYGTPKGSGKTRVLRPETPGRQRRGVSCVRRRRRRVARSPGAEELPRRAATRTRVQHRLRRDKAGAGKPPVGPAERVRPSAWRSNHASIGGSGCRDCVF